jgi:NDP-sugar pyrophosphorylase family protein
MRELPESSVSNLALVLCGGKGTRLQSVLPDIPKFLAPILGHPFADYLLYHIHAQGIQEVVLCTGYLSQEIEDHCGNGSRYGLHLRYSKESEPLGTAGAIQHARKYISCDSFWVWNGDSVISADIRPMVVLHRSQKAQATLAITEVSDTARYGSVILGQNGMIECFREKGHSGAGYINSGVYLMNRAVLESIPADRPTAIEHDVFPELIGHGLYGYAVEGGFLDIGTPESYRMALEFFRGWPTEVIFV